jgi:hypothetical protein
MLGASGSRDTDDELWEAGMTLAIVKGSDWVGRLCRALGVGRGGRGQKANREERDRPGVAAHR